MAADGAHARGGRALPRAPSAGAREGGPCHALYLVNLASRDATVRENSLMALRATMETADAIGAEAVVFHVGSHLGFGFDEAVALVEPALRELLELTTDDLWLCMENAAGAGGTIGRSIAELAALATRRTASAARRLPRLVPLVGVGRRRLRSRRRSTRRSSDLDTRSGSTASASST